MPACSGNVSLRSAVPQPVEPKDQVTSLCKSYNMGTGDLPDMYP